MTRRTRKPGDFGFTMYEYDQRDIEDLFRGRRGRSKPRAKVTHYKLSRTQHYAALGPLYGVKRKPDQSLEDYACEAEQVIAEALGPRLGVHRKPEQSARDYAAEVEEAISGASGRNTLFRFPHPKSR
jgi:hypothetical protein